MVQMQSLSTPSASYMRRLQAKAAKRRMFEMTSAGDSGLEKLEKRLDIITRMMNDMSVRLCNACVYVPVWTGMELAEPGLPKWRCEADVGAEVLATSPADYVSVARVAKDGAAEAEGCRQGASTESVADPGDLFSVEAVSVCGGCWQVLPGVCRCGAVQMCCGCAADGLAASGEFAEEGGGTDGAAEEDVGEVTVDMVRVELQRMAQNVERMGSIAQGADGLGGMMGGLHAQLDNMRDNMVTRDAYDRLFDRIRRLEVDV